MALYRSEQNGGGTDFLAKTNSYSSYSTVTLENSRKLSDYTLLLLVFEEINSTTQRIFASTLVPKTVFDRSTSEAYPNTCRYGSYENLFYKVSDTSVAIKKAKDFDGNQTKYYASLYGIK